MFILPYLEAPRCLRAISSVSSINLVVRCQHNQEGLDRPRRGFAQQVNERSLLANILLSQAKMLPMPGSKQNEYDPAWAKISFRAPKAEYDPASPPVLWKLGNRRDNSDSSSSYSSGLETLDKYEISSKGGRASSETTTIDQSSLAPI